MINKVIFSTLISISGIQVAKAQKINRAYIDSFVRSCDSSFKTNQYRGDYVIDNFRYETDPASPNVLHSPSRLLDNKTRDWTKDSILSIVYLKDQFSPHIWVIRAGNGIIVINSRNSQTRQDKGEVLKKAKRIFRRASYPEDPLLVVDGIVIESSDAFSIISKMKVKEIANIDFSSKHYSITKCLVPGQSTSRDVVRVWTIKERN